MCKNSAHEYSPNHCAHIQKAKTSHSLSENVIFEVRSHCGWGECCICAMRTNPPTCLIILHTVYLMEQVKSSHCIFGRSDSMLQWEIIAHGGIPEYYVLDSEQFVTPFTFASESPKTNKSAWISICHKSHMSDHWWSRHDSPCSGTSCYRWQRSIPCFRLRSCVVTVSQGLQWKGQVVIL